MLAYIKLFVFIANQANSVSTAGPYICNHSNLNHTFAMSSVFKQKLLCGCVCADHFTQVLHCEHECVRDLATRPGRLSPMENYLPLHYDYLQFAYFQGRCFTWI